MKISLCILTVCAAIWVVSSSPMDPKRRMVNRPSIDVFGARERRYAPVGAKGRGHRHGDTGAALSSLESRVTKGHYVCGNKLCMLARGIEPANCNGMCQYPID